MIRTIINKNIFRPLKNKFAFSTLSDPFYILGVEKNAEFGDIKKQFYKLANEYHPDKNKSPVHNSFNQGSNEKISYHQGSILSH